MPKTQPHLVAIQPVQLVQSGIARHLDHVPQNILGQQQQQQQQHQLEKQLGQTSQGQVQGLGQAQAGQGQNQKFSQTHTGHSHSILGPGQTGHSQAVPSGHPGSHPQGQVTGHGTGHGTGHAPSQVTGQATGRHGSGETFHGLQFHNPFDFNSYPITNPPIFDSTTLLPYYSEGVQRRRRISISNGQIGQIINHEAFFEHEQPFEEYKGVSNSISSMHLYPELKGESSIPGDASSSNDYEEPSTRETSHELSREASRDPIAGIPPPNHQLLYNNEVIYNPNNGPIPGTAAWKKERLLERNRIAASKCRQRKKQAQQQLQNNVTKYERELNSIGTRMDKQERLLVFYNRILSEYFETQDPTQLSLLMKFSGMVTVDDLNDDDLTLIDY